MIAKQALRYLKGVVSSFKGKVASGIAKSLSPRGTGRLSRVNQAPKPAQATLSVRARADYRLATYPLGYQAEKKRKRDAKLYELFFPTSSRASSPAPSFVSSSSFYTPSTSQPSSPFGFQGVVDDGPDMMMIDEEDILVADNGDVAMNDAPSEFYDDNMDFELEYVVDDFFDDGDSLMEDALPLPEGIPCQYPSHTRVFSIHMAVDVEVKPSSSNTSSNISQSTTYSSVAARHPGSLYTQYTRHPDEPKRVLPLTALQHLPLTALQHLPSTALQQMLQSAAAPRTKSKEAQWQSVAASRWAQAEPEVAPTDGFELTYDEEDDLSGDEGIDMRHPDEIWAARRN
ncbi:hypothetical protein LTR84_007921 [Exophiala bonariae]|uniref:Uncharacterized protein n=1 Tax=Exophiala bonariae TaxID=1690606 RepID=A0AAV9NP76_9EURO|nr:hypothetical protein LTR84_007921 [Exophiala bonariae]